MPDTPLRERDRPDARSLDRDLAQVRARLRESDHRLNNALHLACSLLTLQSGRSHDGDAQHQLDAACGRIALLGAIYVQLAGEAARETVSARRLIGDLCDRLGAGGSVTLTIDAADLALSTEPAIALGLIVHELVSNSLRHAFPDDRPGHIVVRLAPTENGAWLLSVVDDGVGLPSAGGDGGFGLHLVAIMTRRLRGVLARTTDGGTGHAIRFAVDEAAPRATDPTPRARPSRSPAP